MSKERITFFLFLTIGSIILNIETTFSKVIIKSKVYGHSYLGEDLIRYKVLNRQVAKAQLNKLLLVTEGVHGNEYLGLSHKLTKPSYWDQLSIAHPLHQFLNSGGIIYIIPKINPDAIKYKKRFTYINEDLNRDFHRNKLNQQESYYLAQLIEEEMDDSNLMLKVSIDLHCCGGVLLQAKNINIHLDTPFISVHRGDIHKKVPIQHSFDYYQKENMGTLKDYLNNEFEFISFTFENFEMNNPLRELEFLLEKIIHLKD